MSLDHVIDLPLRRPCFHDDDHGIPPQKITVPSPAGSTKKASGTAWVPEA